MRETLLVATLTILGAPTACGGESGVNDGEEPSGEERTVHDQGSLCVLQQDDVARNPFACHRLDFSADRALVFAVDFGICLSSSCDHDAHASCRVTLEGSLVTVTAEGSYRHDGDECTDDCGSLGARCEAALPMGDYEIRYAGNSMPWSLPSTRAKVCMARDFPACCDGDADCVEGTCGTGTFSCTLPE